MKAKLTIFSLIAVMLLFGLVSCETEEDGFEFDQNVNIPNVSIVDENEEAENYNSNSHIRFGYLPIIPTGQTQCFGEVGEIPCPEFGEPFYGQDGSHGNQIRSFTANDDGTVLDGETNLLWQKGYKASVTWYGARTYCSMLSIAGKKWRVPGPDELRSIINYKIFDPAVDANFQDTKSTDPKEEDDPTWFWAASHSKFVDVDISTGLEAASWIINFYDGFIDYTARSNLYNIRCVTNQN